MLVSTEQQAYLQEPVLLCTLYSYKNPGGVGINHRGRISYHQPAYAKPHARHLGVHGYRGTARHSPH